MSKGLYMNVSLALIQYAIKVTKAKSKLSYYRYMCDTGRLPKICCWWKISLLWGAYLGRRPSSKGDHCHALVLPSRESSKKAHLVRHIYGIKWMAFSQITWERYARDSLYSQLSLFLDKWVLEKPPTIHELITWLMFLVHVHRCSLCHFAPLWVFREQTEIRGVLGLTTAQAFTSSKACTKPLPV